MGKIDDMYLENLNEFVFDEKKIVTYKYLAVTLDVHVNISKQMLYTFYTREQQKGKKICATYFLSGFAPANTFEDKEDEPMEADDDKGSGIHNEHFIILCGCHRLEEIKSKFTKLLSVHMYAVSASPVEDFQELKSSDNLTKNSSPHQKPMVYKANSAEEDLSTKDPGSSSKSKRPIDNVSLESPRRKSTVKTESIDEEDSKTIASPKHEAAAKSPPHKKRLFDSNLTNKNDKKKNQKSSSSKSSKSKTNTRQQKLSFKPDSTEKYIIKSRELSPKRKGQTDSVKTEVFESDSEEEEEDSQEMSPSPPPPPPRGSKRKAVKVKKSQPRHQKSKVYIESDSDNADEDVEPDSPPRRKSRIIIESDSDDEDFVRVRSPLKEQQEQPPMEQEESVHGKKRVSKMVSKTFMSEDGYLVTKNVRELVSDDEDKADDESVKMEVEEKKDTATTNTKLDNNKETKTKPSDVIPPKSSSKADGASKKQRKQPASSSQSKTQPSIMNFFQRK